MRHIILVFLLIATACSPAVPQPTITPSIPTLEGSVDILYPEDGSIIYSEALTISGTATTSDFTLKLIGPDEQVIAQVAGQAGDWKVELIHAYNGEPIEVNILAVPIDTETGIDYDIATILLANIDSRPEGIFASITSPAEDDTIGGEMIQISGMASGLQTLFIALIGSNGTVINSQDVTVHNPYMIDDMPWTAELVTNGYTGSAEIHIADGQNIISSITITITAEAG